MDLIGALSYVFGKGQRISDGIMLFNGGVSKPRRKRRYKSSCDTCDKYRVIAKFFWGGDWFRWCYNCADAMYGHKYPSGKLSRRYFHAHCKELTQEED